MARLDVLETFHGISFPGHLHTQESLQSALKFAFQESDILIVSYPKSGEEKAEPRQVFSNSKPSRSRLGTFIIRSFWNYSESFVEKNLKWWREMITKILPHLRNYLDAGTGLSCFEPRWPSLVPHCPKLGTGTVAGAALLSFFSEELVGRTSGHHHTLAFSPAGPCTPRLQNQGQVTWRNCLT